MRARLTYLLLDPRTPAAAAAGITQLLVLLAAIAAIVAVAAGYSPVVLFAQLTVALDGAA